MISIEEFKTKINECEEEYKDSMKKLYDFFINFFNNLFVQCNDYLELSSKFLLKTEDSYNLLICLEKHRYLNVSSHKINDTVVYTATLSFLTNFNISATYEGKSKLMFFQSESCFNKHSNYTLGNNVKRAILKYGESEIFEKIIEDLYEKVAYKKVFTDD